MWVTSSKSISICKDLRVLGSKNLVAGFGFKLRRKFLPEAPQHELLLRRLYHEECLLRSATLINCIHGWTIIFKIGTLSNEGETLRKTVIFRSNFFDVKIVWQYVIFWECNSKLLNWKWYELNLFYLREITSDFLPSFLKCTDKKLPLNLKYYASSL